MIQSPGYQAWVYSRGNELHKERANSSVVSEPRMRKPNEPTLSAGAVNTGNTTTGLQTTLGK